MTMMQTLLHDEAVGVGVVQNPENLTVLKKQCVLLRFGSGTHCLPFKTG